MSRRFNRREAEKIDFTKEISDVARKKAHQLSAEGESFIAEHIDVIGKGFLLLYGLVVLTFAIMSGIVINSAGNDKNLWIIWAVNTFLSLITAGIIYTTTTRHPYVVFFLGLIQLIFGFVILFMSEGNGDINCTKNLTMYKVYMATHSFNLILFFFGVMVLLIGPPPMESLAGAMETEGL
jgi:hypothetical protein